MYAFRSLVVSAAFVLVFASLATASIFQCGLSNHFSVGTDKKDKADFYNAQLSVDVPDYGYSVFNYPRSNTITFGVMNIVVDFRANVVYQTSRGKAMQSKPISQTFHDRISGIAQRSQLNYTDSKINDCHLYLLPGQVNRLSVSAKIAEEIHRLAESCITNTICQKVGKMNTMYRTKSLYDNGLAQLPGLLGSPMTYPGWVNTPLFQNAFNRLVDSGLTILIEGLRSTGRSRINVPNFDTYFKVKGIFFKSSAHLKATNGKFSDLTTLVRESPPVVSHQGMKFIITSKFMIQPAKVVYDYTMKHHLKSAKGTLTAKVKSVNLEAKFVADYNRIPCVAVLDELKVTNFVTGQNTFTKIGNLKNLINNQVWLNKNVRANISRTIEDQLLFTVQTRQPGLWNFNCEKFRP